VASLSMGLTSFEFHLSCCYFDLFDFVQQHITAHTNSWAEYQCSDMKTLEAFSGFAGINMQLIQ